MNKFKVGDRVVRVGCNSVIRPKVVVGSVWTVDKIGSYNLSLAEIQHRGDIFFSIDYFELYEEPKVFSGKFRIKDEEHYRKVLGYLFSIGCTWVEYTPRDLKISNIYVNNNKIYCGRGEIRFSTNQLQEYTLKETTIYLIEAVPAPVFELETIEILGKKYSKVDLENALSTLGEIE